MDNGMAPGKRANQHRQPGTYTIWWRRFLSSIPWRLAWGREWSRPI
jgi:hypothetical protein